jgi:hypothetical protein
MRSSRSGHTPCCIRSRCGASRCPAVSRCSSAGASDHFALNAASEEAFREIRRRLIAEGANATEGGLITDMGSMLSFSFHDPDGAWHEVMWIKPHVQVEEGFKRPPEWKMIDLD